MSLALLLAVIAEPAMAVSMLEAETGRGGPAVSVAAAGDEPAVVGNSDMEGLLMVLGSLAFTVMLLRGGGDRPGD
jgi:hypothetical protein